MSVWDSNQQERGNAEGSETKGNKSCLSACTSQYRSVWFVHHTVWVLDSKIEYMGVDLPHAKRGELSAAAGYA